MIRYLITDDEEHGRINLRYALNAYPNWHFAGESNNAVGARRILSEHAIDVVFLDIHMPDETGLSLAASICQLSNPPLIIFVSAYQQFALAAFEVHALDYLLKPIDENRLSATLSRAEAILNQRNLLSYHSAVRDLIETTLAQPGTAQYWRQISIRSIGKIDTYALDQIHWISSAGNYIEYYLTQHTVLQRITMQQLETYLNPQQFLRCHRRHFVNRKEIAGLHITGNARYQLRLRNGTMVDVSERYIDAVRASCNA